MQIVHDHQGAARRARQPLDDVIRTHLVGAVEFKQTGKILPRHADGAETIQHVLFRILQREEHASTARLHGLHGELEAHQGFALARARPHQQQVAGSQPRIQFFSGRGGRRFGREQTPGAKTLLPGNTVERLVQRDIFRTR